MKLKILLFVLLLGLVAVPAKAAICAYDDGECYDTFFEIFKSKRGGDIEFIKFCYEEAKANGSRAVRSDYLEFGVYIPNAAAEFNRLEGLKFFIEKGHRLDDNTETRTPLQLSSSNGNYAIVKYLLEKGASPIKKDPKQMYDAYYYAKQSGVKSVIDIVKTAWDKWQRTSDLRQKEYKNEIKSINMNDYEKFKLDHKLSKFSADKFFA